MVKRPTPRLDKLRLRVLGQTAQRGSKSELAAALGVTRHQLHFWLSGTMEPGGEATLALLEWVTTAEEKKRRVRGGTQTRLKTQQKRTINEKPSGPRKP